MSEKEIKITDLAVLTIKPGDLVVVKVPEDATDMDVHWLQEFMTQHFNAHEIEGASAIIVPPDVEISIIRREVSSDDESC